MTTNPAILCQAACVFDNSFHLFAGNQSKPTQLHPEELFSVNDVTHSDVSFFFFFNPRATHKKRGWGRGERLYNIYMT